MTQTTLRKAFTVSVALIGIVTNMTYGSALVNMFIDPNQPGVIREILISGIVLEFGWSALLIWTAFKPFERRYVLLFTMGAALLGNVLHSVNHIIVHGISPDTLVTHTIFGVLYSGLYLVAFRAAKPEAKDRPADTEPKAKIARDYGISRETLYQYLKNDL